MASPWTDHEWDEVVRGYSEMLRMDRDSIEYQRRAQVERIVERVGRKRIGVETKLNQISLTLDALGHPSLPRFSGLGIGLTRSMREIIMEALVRNEVIDDPSPQRRLL